MTKKTLVTMVCLLGMGLWAPAQEVPTLVNYQGRLQDGNGNLVPDGNYEIGFRIWSDGTGGTLVWGRTYAVRLSGGLFNVVLGDGGTAVVGAQTNDLAAAFGNASRFLGLTLTKDQTGTVIVNPQEIVPRQQLLTAPYAFKAAVAANASNLGGVAPAAYLRKVGDTVNGNWTINGALGVNGTSALAGAVTVSGNLTVANGSFTLTAGGSNIFQVTAAGTIGGGMVPVGGIIMWSGSAANIPAGWALCDGAQGTPDLRGRFVLAASAATVGNTGGVASVTLTVANLPSHTHPYTDYYFKKISGDWRGGGQYSGSDMTGDSVSTARVTDPRGDGTSFSVIPPYYALAYIMRKQ